MPLHFLVINSIIAPKLQSLGILSIVQSLLTLTLLQPYALCYTPTHFTMLCGDFIANLMGGGTTELDTYGTASRNDIYV